MTPRRPREDRPRTPRALVVLVIGFAIAVIAASGALALRLSGDESVILPEGTRYTEAMPGTWQRVNPLFTGQNPADAALAALVFSALVRIGPDGIPVPDLAAELPTVSADGMEYTFRLRPDARWHDGEPVTSRDVAFTVGRVQEGAFRGDPELAAAWEQVTVQTPDAATVVFRLAQPYAPFLARNATLGILPDHLLRTVDAEDLGESAFNQEPVGSGPYVLASLSSEQAVLRANADHHLGRPSIDEFVLRFYPDELAAVRGLEAGEADGLFLPAATDVRVQEALAGLEGFERHRLGGSKYVILYLNNDQAAFFQEEGVRRAISLALNREALNQAAFAGTAAVSASAIAPGTWAYADQYDLVRQDLDEARRLLETAGWVLPPGARVRVRGGEEFRFTLRVDNDPARQAVAGEVARQLEPLGIRATVVSTTYTVLLRDYLQQRTYDAAIAAWDQGPDPDPYFGWHSSQMGTAGLNIANYADQVVDELIARGRTTADYEVRKDWYRQFQEKWEQTAPSAVLLFPTSLYLVRDGVETPDFGVLFTPEGRFRDVHRWSR